MDSVAPKRRQRYGEEGLGLFRDNVPDQDPYLDEFHDELGSPDAMSPIGKDDDPSFSSSRPPLAVRRSRWKRWTIIILCLFVVIVGVALAVVAGSMLGGDDDDKDKDVNKGVTGPNVPATTTTTAAPIAATMTLAPVVAPPPPPRPSQPTPAPTTSGAPTRTAFPTRPIYWTQVAQDTGTDTGEFMGSAVDVSADGSVVWYGSFNYTDAGRPSTVGRIRRLDVTTGFVSEVFGTHQDDSLGYTVSGSADGEFVAGFTSSNGTIMLYDYLTAQGEMRVYATATLPSSWDYMTVIVDLSKDGQWLAVTGTQVREGEPGLDAIDWKLRVYQVVTGSGGSLVQSGPDVTVEGTLDVPPKLYAVETSRDGAVVAVSIVGVDSDQWGRVRVYQREPNGYYNLMGNLAGDSLLSSNAARASDFYGRRMQIRTIGGQIWLAIGWEGVNTILMRVWNAAAGVWQDAGELAASEEEYGDKAEFGYDFDISGDGTRMVVGVRCFNFCRGADQVFQLIDGVWTSLGQIVVGYEDTFFGEAVGISDDGTTVIVGAPDDCNDQDGSICGGAIYVYEYQGPELPGGVLTLAPVTASAPTPAPTPALSQSWGPTRTAMPTYSFGWEQTNGVFDSVDQELFAAAVSLSGDGSVLYVGAFENGEYAPESGRIIRVDMNADNSESVVYGEAYDFLGFDISSSRDGQRVAGYLSSSSIIEVADLNVNTGLLEQTAQLQTEFNSTSATFSLSADGKWLAGIGVVDATGMLTIKTYQYNDAGEFVPFGSDIGLQQLTTAPTLDIHLLHDGSYLAVSIAGWNGYAGQVRTYRRTTTGWELAADKDLTSATPNDFFGKTIRLAQTEEGLTLLFVGAPYQNQVLVYQMMENGLEWVPYGQPITAGTDFSDQDEFGFDIDTSTDGSRVVVGVRCFDSCRGAAQVFEHDGTEWVALGEIIAGFADSYFGEAVDCNEDCSIIAVGAPEDCGDDGCGGSVYVFEGRDYRTQS